MSRKGDWLRQKRARERAARLAGNVNQPEPSREEVSEARTYQILEGTKLNVDNPDSVQRLREMAQRGEYPEFIEGTTREGRERFYEEFDRLYPDPPGILNDYRVEPFSRRAIQVYFNYHMAEAESPGIVNLPSSTISEAVRRGVIKHALYVQRPAVENALLTRYGGYSSYDIANRYGKRVLSTVERTQADREMLSQVEQLMGSPVSNRGQISNANSWLSRDGGWVLITALTAEDLGYRPTRGGR